MEAGGHNALCWRFLYIGLLTFSFCNAFESTKWFLQSCIRIYPKLILLSVAFVRLRMALYWYFVIFHANHYAQRNVMGRAVVKNAQYLKTPT